MQTLTANIAKTKFGELLLKAQKEPVQINKNGSPVAVVISCEEYQQLESFKLEQVKQRFAQIEQEISAGTLADGEAFLDSLNQGKFD